MNELDDLDKLLDKNKPEVFAFILIFLGSGIAASIGLNFFGNRYIALPYILFVLIVYLLHRRYERGQQSANHTN